MDSGQEFYIGNESHVFIFDSLNNPDRVRVGVQWGYLSHKGGIPEFSYCCCGEADTSNVNVHGASVMCRVSSRKEVEGAVLEYLNQNRISTASIVREYHNITLTDLKKSFCMSFYGVPGESEVGFHMSGDYDCFGSPHLDITKRSDLLAYAKKMCVLASKQMDGIKSPEFIQLLNLCS